MISINKLKPAFSLRPKFHKWLKADYEHHGIAFISPMLCKECTEKYVNKFEGIAIAQEKLDGHRAICIVTEEGNRFFSRRVSKKTEWMAENTDCVPHLRDRKGLPVGTILDGELVHPSGFSATQSVTGSLPENAIKFQQENGWIEYFVFDLIQLGTDNYEKMDYIFRASMLQKHNIFEDVPICIEDCVGDIAEELLAERDLFAMCVDSFKELLAKMWDDGREGLIIKDGGSAYAQGKRSAQWLKLKECQTFDVIVCGYQEPTKYYDGKTLSEKGYWDYWEAYDEPDLALCKRMKAKDADEYAPVTKPYAMGWIGAIEVGLLKDGKVVKIGEVKGISDADQEYISENREELIGTVIEIKAQSIIDKETNSLRHPRFNRWRKDKSAESCTWEGFGE